MRIGTLMASVSRHSGGLFESVRNLNIAMVGEGGVELEVYGLMDRRDKDVISDGKSWFPLAPHVFPVVGPWQFGYAPSIYSAIARADLDIVHTHVLWTYLSIVVNRWAKNSKKPYLVSPRGSLDSWALRNSRLKKEMARLFYEAKHLEGAACIHALSASEAESIRALGLRNPICVIPNGIGVSQREIDIVPSWAGRVPANRRRLLYLGRIHPKKGLSNLLHAWRRARMEVFSSHDWHLVIAGWEYGSYPERLAALAYELKISDSVTFVGPQFGSDKSATYRDCDAFILPSFSEGLPMAVLEAWAFGLPVLMTPQCNIVEGFVQGGALRIEPDTGDIVRGLYELFNMTDEGRKSVGAVGKRIVEERFTWGVIKEEFISVYRWLIGAAERPRCVILE